MLIFPRRQRTRLICNDLQLVEPVLWSAAQRVHRFGLTGDHGCDDRCQSRACLVYDMEQIQRLPAVLPQLGNDVLKPHRHQFIQLAEILGLETDQLLLDKVSKALCRLPSRQQPLEASLGLLTTQPLDAW